MTSGIALAFVLGWLLGTWMSWRKILADRRLAARTRERMAESFSKRVVTFLKENEVIVTVTDENENTELKVDQGKLDALLGKDPTEH